MTDAEWLMGWDEIYLHWGHRVAQETPDLKARRAASYREHLRGLTSEQWAHGVKLAIEDGIGDEFFPSVVTLRTLAETWRPPIDPSRTLDMYRPAEEVELDREARRVNAKGLLDYVTKYCESVGIEPPVKREMPASMPEDERNQRLEDLRRQAEQITTE